jgi:RimJ/RimL family protein N-acetyltransferase
MIELKPFRKNDFSTLIQWIDKEDDLIQFSGNIFSFPLTDNQLDDYLADLNRNAFKVVYKDDNSIIGHSEIYFSENKTAKLCRILIGNSKFRGKGLGQAIVKELIRISFENYDAKKIELNVYDWNTSAINCYEKVGFKVMNGITKTTKIKNQVWTAVNMIITRDDWHINSENSYDY